MTAIRIPDVRLVHSNFAGKEGPYNEEGKRNFAVYLDNAKIATNLASIGLKVNSYPKQLGWWLAVNIDTDDYEIEVTDTEGIKRSESWWPQLDEYNVRADVFISPRSYLHVVNGQRHEGAVAMLLAIDIKKMEEKENADATS